MLPSQQKEKVQFGHFISESVASSTVHIAVNVICNVRFSIRLLGHIISNLKVSSSVEVMEVTLFST